jgi:hypothetical protein
MVTSIRKKHGHGGQTGHIVNPIFWATRGYAELASKADFLKERRLGWRRLHLGVEIRVLARLLRKFTLSDKDQSSVDDVLSVE